MKEAYRRVGVAQYYFTVSNIIQNNTRISYQILEKSTTQDNQILWNCGYSFEWNHFIGRLQAMVDESSMVIPFCDLMLVTKMLETWVFTNMLKLSTTHFFLCIETKSIGRKYMWRMAKKYFNIGYQTPLSVFSRSQIVIMTTIESGNWPVIQENVISISLEDFSYRSMTYKIREYLYVLVE